MCVCVRDCANLSVCMCIYQQALKHVFHIHVWFMCKRGCVHVVCANCDCVFLCGCFYMYIYVNKYIYIYIYICIYMYIYIYLHTCIYIYNLQICL